MDDIIWIASYPRSGNTFIRLLLRQCLGLRTGSFYADDFGGRKPLEQAVGHVEHIEPGRLRFEAGEPRLVKTHAACTDDRKTIYIVRDGRAATVSLWRFLGGTCSLRDTVEGKSEFGLWRGHLDSWNPLARTGTLCLKYEDVVADPLPAVEALARFLDRPVISRTVPSRESLLGLDDKWITRGTDWREFMTVALEERFVELNGPQLQAHGYLDVGDGSRFQCRPSGRRATSG